jgi:hypothetical protein
MIYLISHRANINGPHTALYGENHPSSIKETLKNFNVEIDVWLINNLYLLGHDEPQYEVDISFLKKDGLWCHAKNIETLSSLVQENIHCFVHNTDFATLTSRGWIWTYPGQPIISSHSIAVMPETIKNYNIDKAGGICSDFITQYTSVPV